MLEYLPKILGGADDELAKTAKKILSKQGLEFVLQAKVTGAKVEGDEVVVSYEDKKGEAREVKGDRLLVSVGRKAPSFQFVPVSPAVISPLESATW